jgi:hypothetical protein
MANLLEGRCRIILNLDGFGPTEFVGINKVACGTLIAVPTMKIQLDAGNNVYNFKPDAVFIHIAIQIILIEKRILYQENIRHLLLCPNKWLSI